MKLYQVFVGALALVTLSGCATLSPELQARYSTSVEMALTTAPDELKAAADKGDGHAQLGYSFVLRYGLNGVPADPASADAYRARAVASRGTTTSAVYVPGYKRVPGHTQLLNVPQYDVNLTEADAAQDCAAVLAGTFAKDLADKKVQSGTCGGEAGFIRLQSLWAKAKH